MLKVKCKRCALGEHRTRIVIGRGKTPADILMLGEAPGRAEDIIGEPFIGGSGKLLDLIIKKSYLHEYSIYFTNIVLCRAWDWRKSSNFWDESRPPMSAEVLACMPNLTKIIQAVKPKLTIFIGKIAQRYYRRDLKPNAVMLHPEFLLRTGGDCSPYYGTTILTLNEAVKRWL